MKREPTIAILDVGKTNKKIFLFDRNYTIVFQKSLRLEQRLDEDGYECEDLPRIEHFLFSTLEELVRSDKYDVKAINFSGYGASLVHLAANGRPAVEMFNYLKPYPDGLIQTLLPDHDSKTKFELATCCPIQGNLNAGLQLFRIYSQKKALFDNITTSLHFPQYLSYLLTQKKYSDITSIGCHTSLWNFKTHTYHSWVYGLGLDKKLAPIVPNNEVSDVNIEGQKLSVGIGIHDSSAALVPYLKTVKDPFLLVSTGTWSITLNPFNQQGLTEWELQQGCLCYLSFQGKSVKASRVFLGNQYAKEIHRIADHFQKEEVIYNQLEFEKERLLQLRLLDETYDAGDDILLEHFPFSKVDLKKFENDVDAYYQLMFELAHIQKHFIAIIDPNDQIKSVFVDGGFGHNCFFMHMMAFLNPTREVYAAEVPQSTAIGAALVIHDAWNEGHAIARSIVQLEKFSY
ncbi:MULTISPECIES: FGGY-family carbohydrate kinase [Chitinophagaceae]